MLLPHGEFLPWVETLPFDERTAQRYMKLNHYKNKTDTVSDLQEAYRQLETIEQQGIIYNYLIIVTKLQILKICQQHIKKCQK